MIERSYNSNASVLVLSVQEAADKSFVFNFDNTIPIKTHSHLTRIFNARIDIGRNRLYFHEANTKALYSVENFHYEFTNWTIRSIYKGASASYTRIAVDWVSNNIYWTEPSYKTVLVQSAENGKTKTLISDGLTEPFGIAVDPFHK